MSTGEQALPHGSIDPAAAPATAGAERERGGRLGRDVAITAFTQALVGIGGLLLYRLIALQKGADGVAVYALVKQVGVFAWPIVMIGMHTAIPRYVALARDRAGGAETFLLASVALTGATTAVTCIAALISPHTTALLVFGESDRAGLVGPFAATLVATVLINMTYGYFRGRADFAVGNVVCVAGLAVFPVGILLIAGDRSITTLIVLIAALTIAPCVAALAKPLARGLRHFHATEVRDASAVLLNYGHRRVTGDLASAALFTLPPILAAHVVGLHGVAYLSAGMYMLSMITVVFQPVGLVFLPLLSRLCPVDFDEARRYVRLLTTSAVHVALFITPQLILFAGIIVRAWLGRSFVDAGTIITITVCPAGVYVFNVVLRSALDAASVTAYNSRNNMLALAAAAVCVALALASGITDSLTCIAVSLAVGVSLFGLLTLVSVHRVYRLDFDDYALPVTLALGLLTAAVALPIRLFVVGDDTSLESVALIGALECVLGIAYFAGLARSGVVWPSAIREQIRARL